MDSLILTSKQLEYIASEAEHYARVCAGSARYSARRLPPDSELLRYPSAESGISMKVVLDDDETSLPLSLTVRITATPNNAEAIGGTYVTFKSIPGSIKKMVKTKFKDQPITEEGLRFSTNTVNQFVIPVRSGHKRDGYYGEVVYDATVELTPEK